MMFTLAVKVQDILKNYSHISAICWQSRHCAFCTHVDQIFSRNTWWSYHSLPFLKQNYCVKVYEPQGLLISVVGTQEHANGIYWKLHHVYLWFSDSAWKIFFLWRRIWAVRMSIQNTVAKTPIVDKGLDAQTIKKLWVYCSSQYQPDLYEE